MNFEGSQRLAVSKEYSIDPTGSDRDEQAKFYQAMCGCERSLNDLLTAYNPKIYWFIRRMGVRRHHDIEEITQETLIQIQRSISRSRAVQKSPAGFSALQRT